MGSFCAGDVCLSSEIAGSTDDPDGTLNIPRRRSLSQAAMGNDDKRKILWDNCAAYDAM
jgi:hypothetical protein